jgi:hypothetical protein
MGTVDEIRTFAVSGEGRHWDSQWYDRIAYLVESAIKQQTDEEAEQLLGSLIRMIADSGPLGDRFVPSLYQAVDVMRRKQGRTS